MTDKIQKIRKKVERLKSLISNNPFLSDYEKGCNDGREDMCNEIISIIESLQKEPVSDDLKKAAENYAFTMSGEDEVLKYDAFIEGAHWQKEQMMTKSIEAVVSQVPCSNEIILYNPSSVDKYYLPQEMNKLGLNKGDKVKLVIIKEK